MGVVRPGVSRRHSRLIFKNDGWMLEDLGSTNGTYINGVKITPNQPKSVINGDKLRFGKIELEFMAQ